MSRKLIGIMVVSGLLAAALLSACSLKKDAAKTRVENVLNRLKKDDMSTEFQLAVCQWFDGSYVMSASDLEVAQNHFLVWLKEKSIRLPVKISSVQDVELKSGAVVPTAVVTVSIDGRPYKIKVAKDQQMVWASSSE